MPRRSAATIRPIEPDARYRNRLVQQLVNKVMEDGKKSLSERIVYDALAIVGERSGEDPVETLESAVKSRSGRRHPPAHEEGQDGEPWPRQLARRSLIDRRPPP